MNILALFNHAHNVADGLGRSSQRVAAHKYIKAKQKHEVARGEYCNGQQLAAEVQIRDQAVRDAHNKFAASLGVDRATAHNTLFGGRG